MHAHASRPFDRLSEGQLAVLALVAEFKSSKQIARELGISPNTVDQRLKRVQAILGVNSRFDAARIYRNERGGSPEPLWGDLVYPTPGLAGPTLPEEEEPAPGLEDRTGAGSTALRKAQAAYVADVPAPDAKRPWISVLLEAGRPNELSWLARALCIGVLTLAALLALAAAVSLAEGMSRLF